MDNTRESVAVTNVLGHVNKNEAGHEMRGILDFSCKAQNGL